MAWVRQAPISVIALPLGGDGKKPMAYIARSVSHANFDQLAAAAGPERKVGKKKDKSAQ